MKTIFNVIKKAFLWSYARNTWQWDFLCVLCLIFIFLTPKSWFTNGERHKQFGHQTGASKTVFVGAELVDNERDTARLEQQVRRITGQVDARIDRVRPKVDESGRTIAYEVDIH